MCCAQRCSAVLGAATNYGWFSRASSAPPKFPSSLDDESNLSLRACTATRHMLLTASEDEIFQELKWAIKRPKARHVATPCTPS